MVRPADGGAASHILPHGRRKASPAGLGGDARIADFRGGPYLGLPRRNRERGPRGGLDRASLCASASRMGSIPGGGTARARGGGRVRIVLFKLNHLGDNIAFVPAVQALRSMCPDWQITVLTTPGAAELYGGPLGPQEILTCPKSAFDKSYRRPWELAWWIWSVRRRRPGACLVAFDQSNVAHAAARFSGAGVRIGGNLGRIRVTGSLTGEIPIPEDARPVTWNWRMARALAGSFGRAAQWPDEPPPPDLRHLLARGARPRGSRGRVVGHAGARRGLNQWPLERFASDRTRT